MFEKQFIEQRREELGTLAATTSDSYELQEVEETEPVSELTTPYLVEKLSLYTQYAVDPNLKIKINAVDEFIKLSIEKEGLVDSVTNYTTILNRLLERLPQPLESMLKHKEYNKILDFLFGEAAIRNGLSRETYFKKINEELTLKRIEQLKNVLRLALQLK